MWEWNQWMCGKDWWKDWGLVYINKLKKNNCFHRLCMTATPCSGCFQVGAHGFAVCSPHHVYAFEVNLVSHHESRNGTTELESPISSTLY
jgi:hypothetical protein